jgi:anti-anti-sigma regulatory factor
MPTAIDSSATTTLVSGCVVVTFPADLADGLSEAQQATLERVRVAGARAAVLELSAVRFLDRAEFDGLRGLVGMLRLVGARAVLVGLRPGVVAWLVSSDVDLAGLEFERDLEGALLRLGVAGLGVLHPRP